MDLFAQPILNYKKIKIKPIGIFSKYKKTNFNQNLAQTLRIKKGSKTKCLETLTGVAPPITRSCNQNSLYKFVTIRKLMS